MTNSNSNSKFKKQKAERHRFLKRAGCTDKHHLITRSNGGESISSNLLRIDIYRHDAWHLLFKNRTIDEIIKHLKLFKNYKEFIEEIDNYYKHQAYKLLLGRRTIKEVVLLMLRIKSIKNAQSLKGYTLFESAKKSKLKKIAA